MDNSLLNKLFSNTAVVDLIIKPRAMSPGKFRAWCSVLEVSGKNNYFAEAPTAQEAVDKLLEILVEKGIIFDGE